MEFWVALPEKWRNLKLKTKLTIAFLSIVVTAIIILSAAVGYSTKVFFDEYVYNQSKFKALQWRDFLASYYLQNNFSWDGMQLIFEVVPRFPQRRHDRGFLGRDRLILLDPAGKVLADSEGGLTIGEKPPALDHKTEAAIIINGEKVGTVLLGVTPPPGVFPLEERFSRSVSYAVIMAGLGTAFLAIFLSLYFSRRIAVPLVSLAEGAQKLAGKNFHYRFPVEGNDEVGLLSRQADAKLPGN